MCRARTWIVLVTIGHLAACSSTFKEISPTPSSGQPNGKAGPFLNSPFFLAIETGVLVGGITQLYNWAKASSDRKLAEDNARREKQITVLSSVANDLPVYISTMGSLMKLKEWLKNKENQQDEVGRTREEVIALYTEFFRLFLKTKNSVAILTEVSSFYEEKAVCTAVGAEDRAIGKIHEAKGEDERKTAMKAEGGTFSSLLGAMAEEIRRPPRKVPDKDQRADQCLDQANASPAKR